MKTPRLVIPMFRRSAPIITLALMMLSHDAMCYSVKEMDLESKVAKSDLVAIAKVDSVSGEKCGQETSCATITPIKVLKGQINGEVVVLFGGALSELNPLCCETGSIYLFFIKQDKDGYFETVNGPYGIHKIP